MCGSMVAIQSPTAEIRRGKQTEEDRNPRAKYNGLPYYTGRPQKGLRILENANDEADNRRVITAHKA